VRTPEEHAAGHVEGTLLIDIGGTDFADRIAQLDPKGAYVVYCRSGNRSAQATAQMQAIGLDVVDGGALTDMADAGWPTA
jgi:phage shock protein E